MIVLSTRELSASSSGIGTLNDWASVCGEQPEESMKAKAPRLLRQQLFELRAEKALVLLQQEHRVGSADSRNVKGGFGSDDPRCEVNAPRTTDRTQRLEQALQSRAGDDQQRLPTSHPEVLVEQVFEPALFGHRSRLSCGTAVQRLHLNG